MGPGRPGTGTPLLTVCAFWEEDMVSSAGSAEWSDTGMQAYLREEGLAPPRGSRLGNGHSTDGNGGSATGATTLALPREEAEIPIEEVDNNHKK